MLGGKCKGRTEGRRKKVSKSVTESERTIELTDLSLIPCHSTSHFENDRGRSRASGDGCPETREDKQKEGASLMSRETMLNRLALYERREQDGEIRELDRVIFKVPN